MKIREGKLPTGKGMFLWILARLEDGDMKKLAERLHAEGYGWVCVKLQDGVIPFKGYKSLGYRQQELIGELIPHLQRLGIEFHGWGYIYGKSTWTFQDLVDREIAVTLAMIEKWKPLSFHINAEKEYKQKNSLGRATRYMTGVRLGMQVSGDNIPDIPLLLSSFRFPEYHQEVPYAEFGRFIDAWAPQVYWQKANNPVEQLQQSVAQHKAIRDLPFVVAGTIYPQDDWRPTPEHIRAFNQAARDMDEVIATYYWEYYYLNILPELIEPLAEFKWEVTEDPPPEPGLDEDGIRRDERNLVLDQVAAAVEELRPEEA